MAKTKINPTEPSRQRPPKPGHVCHHCKQWIKPEESHNCWTTTEAALTRHLPEDPHEAWERLRETAADFGEQRIYASGRAIMFARKTCYFFVRPKKSFLEVCIFLGRKINAPQVRRVDHASKSKLYHIIHITHRDEVEAPFTDWLREAYEVSDALSKGDAALKTPARTADNNQMPEKRALRAKAPAAKKDHGTQLKRVRRICGSIPGTVEKISHGTPTFFTPKRVFAIFVNNHHDDGHVAAWVPAAPGVQQALIEEAPDIYFRPPYVGVSGWVGVETSKVTDDQLGAMIREAFRLVTTKAASRPARAGKTPRRRKA